MRFDDILAALFPPKLPSLEARGIEADTFGDHLAAPVTECGILWRGYDVRQTGIEKHFGIAE